MGGNPGRKIDRVAAREIILRKLGEGHSRTASAAAAGVSRSVLWRWLRADAKLLRDVEIAEARAEIEIVDLLLANAKAGDRESIRQWLRARRRDEWDDAPNNARVALGFDPRASFAHDPFIIVQFDVRELERMEAANEARARSSTPTKANGETTPLIDAIVEAEGKRT